MNDRLASWDVSESTVSGFADFDLEGDLAGFPYEIKAGVRIVHTDLRTRGYQSNLQSGGVESIRGGQNYLDVLPSLNARIEMAPDHIFRLGLARAIARPPLDELGLGFNLERIVAGQNTVARAESGNSRLKPFRAIQVDLSYEWYFTGESLFSTGLFYKHLESYIGFQRQAIDYQGVEVEVLRPINGEGGHIKGIELTFQHAFASLPAPFDGFGVFGNYTLVDSNIREFSPVDNPLPLNGLSRHTASLSLWHSKGPLEIIIDYAYKSAFTRSITWDSSLLQTNRAEKQWNLGVSYALSDSMGLVLQGINLGAEPLRVYNDNEPSRLGRYESYGRQFYLGFRLTI